MRSPLHPHRRSARRPCVATPRSFLLVFTALVLAYGALHTLAHRRLLHRLHTHDQLHEWDEAAGVHAQPAATEHVHAAQLAASYAVAVGEGGLVAGGLSGRKEKILHADVDLQQVLVQLPVPRTASWSTTNVTRTFINQQQWDNKYDRHTKGAKSWMPAEDHNPGHRTCAVVGNGGVLLRETNGAAIDAADAVFRFNDGPTAGWERHVGRRTTYRLINNNWARAWLHKRPKGTAEDSLVLFGMGAARSVEGLAKRWPQQHVYFLSPEFAGAARGAYKQAYLLMAQLGVIVVDGRNSPPTGMEGLFLALQLCERVALYGFNVDVDAAVPYHYHDHVKGVEAAHSFGFQSAFLTMLVNAGRFVLCTPQHRTPACDHTAPVP